MERPEVREAAQLLVSILPNVVAKESLALALSFAARVAQERAAQRLLHVLAVAVSEIEKPPKPL